MSSNSTTLETRFVYKAWLDAGGAIETIEPQLIEWLFSNSTILEADFVYKAWLEAGGDLHLIREPLIKWFTYNKEYSKIDFLCHSWLKSGGDFLVVQEAATNWLNDNYQNEEAMFLTQSLLNQKDLPIETIIYILKWCQRFSTNSDGLSRLISILSRHFHKEDISLDICLAAEAILIPLLQ
ncbi:MAG: hypothetical protein NT070_15705 [Cyanobacteria bacterium]|nr:hypothetical protein [Cyanobacteriota bacterium]